MKKNCNLETVSKRSLATLKHAFACRRANKRRFSSDARPLVETFYRGERERGIRMVRKVSFIERAGGKGGGGEGGGGGGVGRNREGEDSVTRCIRG